MWLWVSLGLVVLWCAVWVAARWLTTPRRASEPPNALEILSERLRRGEITNEQYRRERRTYTTGH